MTKQKISSGDNSTNIQAGKNVYHTNDSNIVINESDGEVRTKFISDLLKKAFFIIVAIIAWLLNPSMEDHINKIKHGVFRNYNITGYDNNKIKEKNIIFIDSLVCSFTYALNDNADPIPLSFGFFKKIIETKEYMYYQDSCSDTPTASKPNDCLPSLR